MLYHEAAKRGAAGFIGILVDHYAGGRKYFAPYGFKEKDIIELKRAINKLKKTCDAIDGDIAGFGEDYIVCCPTFAKIHREKSKRPQSQEKP